MKTKKQNVIVITGASSGVGEGLLNLYKNDGDIVVNLSKSVQTENKLNYRCDVTSEADVKRAIDGITKDFGKIDILINCAGFGVFGAVELTPVENIKKMFDVNLFGAITVAQYALKLMSAGLKL